MTIILSQAGLNEIFATFRQNDRNPPRSDSFVTRWKIPELIGQGIGQFFELRQGLGLLINDWRSRHDLVITDYSRPDSWLHYGFCLGSERFWTNDTTVNSGQHLLWGNGMSETKVEELPAVQQAIWIEVHMMPELLYSFVGDASGQLPATFEHLVKPPDQERSLMIIESLNSV